MKRIYWYVIPIIFLSIIFGCVRQNNNVKIGALLALTGSGANYGKSIKQGLGIALEEINS